MKVLVFGAMSMSGKSLKTGSEYDMKRLFVASELKSKRTDAYTRDAAGYEAAEVEVDPACFHQFLSLRYPVQLDLETDMRLQGGKLVPVVTGIIPKSSASAAA